MQLTGKQIITEGIVTNVDSKAIQQQGVDVRIDKIYSLSGTGLVPVSGKTKLPTRAEIKPGVFCGKPTFILEPGYYEVDLVEGIHMPNNAALQFKTRSSLVRCGAIVESGQFDAGFDTDKAGCYLIVHRPINIEVNARIAQAIVYKSDPVDNNYNGQYQGDKQRS